MCSWCEMDVNFYGNNMHRWSMIINHCLKLIVSFVWTTQKISRPILYRLKLPAVYCVCFTWKWLPSPSYCEKCVVEWFFSGFHPIFRLNQSWEQKLVLAYRAQRHITIIGVWTRKITQFPADYWSLPPSSSHFTPKLSPSPPWRWWILRVDICRGHFYLAACFFQKTEWNFM